MAYANNVAFANLRAEMAREGVTIQDIAGAWGVTRDTASNKLSRKSPLNLDEAFVIERRFFPGVDIQYLFKELSCISPPGVQPSETP